MFWSETKSGRGPKDLGPNRLINPFLSWTNLCGSLGGFSQEEGGLTIFSSRSFYNLISSFLSFFTDIICSQIISLLSLFPACSYCFLYKPSSASAHISIPQFGSVESIQYRHLNYGRDFFFHKEMQLYYFQVHM